MIKLDSYIALNSAAIKAANLTNRFSDADLARIGSECLQGYKNDEASRRDWLRRNEAGMNLALQIVEDKNFPWQGCANVKFPLVTIAAMQFHARAYPAIVSGSQIVKCTTFGENVSEQVTQRATRISDHMSWQLLYEDRCWEDQEDKAIFNVSIVGCNFKKSYRKARLGHNVSELVLAKDLVLNYWAKSVDECPRKSHKQPKFRNEVREEVLRGTWRDVLGEAWYIAAPLPTTSETQQKQDSRQGVTPPPPDDSAALMFLEQHINIDLDGDGYDEPYIITFHQDSATVVRIVCRFSEEDVERVPAGVKGAGKILCVKAEEYFTKKTFIPSPDGGIYDVGFGVFLGPLNSATNSLINMLLDCGTMQTTSGGFLGRGAKFRGGVYTMAPFEWKRVDASGDDLRKNLIPLQPNAPSDVLFQLLSLLINYGSRVAGTTDITVGENPGQNTPAQTTQTMVEMGQKIYTAVFKRIWRASKDEFRKLFKLNGIYLPLDPSGVFGVSRMDYQGEGNEIAPVADPNITSDSMKLQIAGTLVQRAAVVPGYNKDAVERRFLSALHVDAPGEIFQGSEGMEPPKDPKLLIQEVKEQGASQRLQMELQAEAQQFVIELMEQRRLNNAKIIELMASAENESANAQTEIAYAQVAMVNAEISRIKIANESLNKRIEHFLEAARLRSEHALEVKAIEASKTTKAEK